jgi:hypothetical protein
VGVAGFGEAFALVFATRAALVHAAAALVTPSRGPLP